jgi:hypothetical protein
LLAVRVSDVIALPPSNVYLPVAQVDPEIKKKLDQTIQEARQALEVINGDANNLAAEERDIRALETQFKEKFVCRFLFGM